MCPYESLPKIFAQFDSVHTVEDALTHISQPQRASQPVQVGQLSSSDVSQQVQIEALPPVLVLRLKRLLYDARTRYR
jgi:ubiquitin carboxyl-terminal hydrolase 10